MDQRIDDIADFVSETDRVLDVGCGNGQFGEAIAKRLKADVRGVDVVDYANADIPITFFDGVHLPFEDNSFDVIIMAMMLHHVPHQEELIDEAIRCSRRGLIIYEDTYFSPWQKLAIIWNDFYSNRVIGLVRVLKGLEGKAILKMPLPFTFRCVNGWQKLFAEKSLTNKNTIVRHLGIKPHSKVTFLLQKKGSV
ncbi:MAG: class I SAM-dependent methyltransferase [Robiginitomaculum sp.]|nr:class I SAM-dependent methyltransferase [Robiginitomaculum sp.]